MYNEEFLLRLFHTLCLSINNDHSDNFDYIRFTPSNSFSLKGRIVKAMRKKFMPSGELRDLSVAMDAFTPAMYASLCCFYKNLENEESRNLLVHLIAYRLLGHSKVRLPLSQPAYWQGFKRVDELIDKKDNNRFQVGNMALSNYDLKGLNYPLRLKLTAMGVYTDFVLEQYAYRSGDMAILVKPGDVVVDAGGCWGDTALYFAEKAGDTGHVFVYEFIPGNLKLLHDNINMNPLHKDRIEVIENPVWDTSGIEVYYTDEGPGSKVSFDPLTGAGKSTTLSIDDLVKNRQLGQVDFIKMDIEGAEPNALKGAGETIRKFKPTLAIAIYHSMNDFIGIPAWIKNLDMDYKLFLGHYTIHKEETVLFAVHPEKLDRYQVSERIPK